MAQFCWSKYGAAPVELGSRNKETYVTATEKQNQPNPSDLLALTTQIVAAHVSNNAVAPADLPDLIRSVHEALTQAGSPEVAEEAAPVPPVSIRRSIQPDYLICLEDGKKLKMLKRHLSAAYGMTPEQYRAKWGLPHDYPMVAPRYAAERSALAKEIGLGRRGRGGQPKAAGVGSATSAAASAAKAPVKRGRKKAAS